MKKLLLLFIFVFVTGCATGGTKFIETVDGSIRIDSAADIGFVHRGASLTKFGVCDKNHENCKKIGEPLIQTNPTLVEQFSGLGEMAILSDGIKGSGDSTTNSANADAHANAKASIKKSKTVIHKNPHRTPKHH